MSGELLRASIESCEVNGEVFTYSPVDADNTLDELDRIERKVKVTRCLKDWFQNDEYNPMFLKYRSIVWRFMLNEYYYFRGKDHKIDCRTLRSMPSPTKVINGAVWLLNESEKKKVISAFDQMLSEDVQEDEEYIIEEMFNTNEFMIDFLMMMDKFKRRKLF